MKLVDVIWIRGGEDNALALKTGDVEVPFREWSWIFEPAKV